MSELFTNANSNGSMVANPELFDSVIEDIRLRDYQLASLSGLRANIAHGIKSQILSAPTGSGKTEIASYMLRECWRKGHRAVFVVDRLSLLGQTSMRLDRYGIPHGVIQAQHPRTKPDELIQVASLQTLTGKGWPEASLIVIDECHVTYKFALDKIAKQDAIVIGLTATPFTRGLGKHYKAIVNVTTGNKLTAEGWLTPFRVWAANEPDMTGAKVVAGEWTDDECSKRATRIVGDVVAEYFKHGESRKFIAFGVDVAHCEVLRTQFIEAGVNVALYTYLTPDHEREPMLHEFRKPDSKIRGLISVAALSRGFDVPDVSAIIMCRPLKSSFAEFVQVIGRGLRACEGKTNCHILDLSGNFMRHYRKLANFFEHGCNELDDGKRELAKEKKIKERPPRKCPQCFHVFDKGRECPACGYLFSRQSNIEHEQGELGEFDLQSQSVSRNIKPPYVGHILKREPLPHWKPASEKQSYYLRKLGYRGEVPSAWHAHRLITAYTAHEEQKKAII